MSLVLILQYFKQHDALIFDLKNIFDAARIKIAADSPYFKFSKWPLFRSVPEVKDVLITRTC